MEIAKTIARQIGNPSLFMIGAKNIVAGDNFLSFRIGRNSKRVNHIKITLNSLDLYDIEFGWIYGTKYTVKNTEKNIYFDMLRPSIEKNTGMVTGGIR